MDTPVVFISSTCGDLTKTGHRAARDAALGAELSLDMQEYWAAQDHRPLRECLARITKADVLVVIVAYRFGWVPPDQPEKDPRKQKSITWLECEKAGKDKLLTDFLQVWTYEGVAWYGYAKSDRRPMTACARIWEAVPACRY